LSDPESTVGVRFASKPCQTTGTARPATTTTRPAGAAIAPSTTKPNVAPGTPAAGVPPAATTTTTTTTTAVPRQDTELGRVRGRGRGKPLEVEQVDTEACVAIGDGVITAGVTESLFPRGIPIGRVSTVERRPGSLDLLVRVKPVVDLQQLSIVEVLLYDGDAAFAGR
jgi:rod shape-determining protein MreC